MAEDEVETPERELSPEVEAEPDDAAPRNEDSPESEGTERKTDKRVRDAQEALRQANEEKARLTERLARLEAVVEERTKPAERESAPKPFSYLDDPDTISTAYDDPTNLQKILKNLTGDIVGLLEMRDRAFMERLSEQSPEMQDIKDRVDEVAKDPDFAGWRRDDIARLIRKFEKPASKPDGFRPGPGSRRAPTREASGEMEDMVKQYMNRLGYKD